MKLEQDVLDNAPERWRSITGYKGLYEVSDMGKVRSLDRVVKYRDGRVYNYKGKVLSLLPNKAGYVQADLYRNTKYKTTYVHILVLKAFKRQPKGKTEVNHRNGIKHDNRLPNLHWCTRIENVSHAISEGLSTTRGSNCHNSKLTEDEVISICGMLDAGYSLGEISEMTDLTPEYIGEIRRGSKWSWLTGRKGNVSPVDRRGSKNKFAKSVRNCRGEIFGSLIEAASKYNISSTSSLSKVCKGKLSHAGRYSDNTRIKWFYN